MVVVVVVVVIVRWVTREWRLPQAVNRSMGWRKNQSVLTRIDRPM